MNVEVRVYKRYDTDLLALHDAGYSITKMMKEAVSAYANGEPCYFFLDEIIPFDLNDKKSVRLRLPFDARDTNVSLILRNIKHGYRSNFCKQVLRNSIIQQNLFCYSADDTMMPFHETNARMLNLHLFPGVKLASEYRRTTQQVKILGEEHTLQHPHGTKILPSSAMTTAIPKVTRPISNYSPVSNTNEKKAEKTQAYKAETKPVSKINPHTSVAVTESNITAVDNLSGGQERINASVVPETPTTKPRALEIHVQETTVNNKPILEDTTVKNTDAPELAGDDAMMDLFDNL